MRFLVLDREGSPVFDSYLLTGPRYNPVEFPLDEELPQCVPSRNDDMDPGRRRSVIDDPWLKVITYTVTTEHHIVEVDEVAAFLSAVIKVEAALVFEALREELQHLLLALPILLDA